MIKPYNILVALRHVDGSCLENSASGIFICAGRKAWALRINVTSWTYLHVIGLVFCISFRKEFWIIARKIVEAACFKICIAYFWISLFRLQQKENLHEDRIYLPFISLGSLRTCATAFVYARDATTWTESNDGKSYGDARYEPDENFIDEATPTVTPGQATAFSKFEIVYEVSQRIRQETRWYGENSVSWYHIS